MKVSLTSLLRTGDLGDLRRGMSKADIEALLGPPDDVGGTSRKYRKPRIYLYGAMELFLEWTQADTLEGFQWEAGDKGPFRFSPTCRVEDWAFTPEWTFEQVEDYLNELGLPREYREPPAGSEDATPVLVLESGVTIQFDLGRLWSVGQPYLKRG